MYFSHCWGVPSPSFLEAVVGLSGRGRLSAGRGRSRSILPAQISLSFSIHLCSSGENPVPHYTRPSVMHFRPLHDICIDFPHFFRGSLSPTSELLHDDDSMPLPTFAFFAAFPCTIHLCLHAFCLGPCHHIHWEILPVVRWGTHSPGDPTYTYRDRRNFTFGILFQSLLNENLKSESLI